MYTFKKFQFDWLNVFVFTPGVGALWKKRFTAGVTPQNQSTLNIYGLGKFRVTAEAAGFEQLLGVGESSLDLTIGEFPTEGLVVESPTEGPACRICLSVEGGGKWSRVKQTVAAGETVNLEPNQIAAVIPATGWDGSGAPDIRVGNPFTVGVDSYVYSMQKLR